MKDILITIKVSAKEGHLLEDLFQRIEFEKTFKLSVKSNARLFTSLEAVEKNLKKTYPVVEEPEKKETPNTN